MNNYNEPVEITCTYLNQYPFLFANNTFNSNAVNEVGGALFLDYGQALQELIGNLSISETNVTDSDNITSYLN